MSTLVKINKSVKISSKGQITLPKIFLNKLGLQNGNSVLIEFSNNQIQISNKQRIEQNKLLKFKPIKLGLPKKMNFSETHNDIYD